MRLISFSLWGNNDLYNKGAIENVYEASEIYPGWKCRFYIMKDCPAISILRELDCEIALMPKIKEYIPEFWRFFAASDPKVERVIFRDCDSRVNTREAAAVDEWIESGLDAHVMRDYPPAHIKETMLAGMWGICGGVIPDMSELIHSWISTQDTSKKYTDQKFLHAIIWPRIRSNVMIHGQDPNGRSRPFPPHKPMKYGDYVGQVIGV